MQNVYRHGVSRLVEAADVFGSDALQGPRRSTLTCYNRSRTSVRSERTQELGAYHHGREHERYAEDSSEQSGGSAAADLLRLDSCHLRQRNGDF